MNEIDMKELLVGNTFANNNGVVVDDIELDYARAHVDITDNSLNPYGTVHGGLYFTLADTCGGVAAISDGSMYVTLDSQVHYIHPATKGRITATANVISRTKKISLVEVEIHSDDGVLCFKASMTYYKSR